MHTGGSDTMDPVSCIFCPDRPSDSTSAKSIREVGTGLRKASSRRNRMAIYSIRDLGRREILVISAVLAGSGMGFSPKPATAEAALQRTPDQILGPFYPLSEA